jgi:hypothetical protein
MNYVWMIMESLGEFYQEKKTGGNLLFHALVRSTIGDGGLDF